MPVDDIKWGRLDGRYVKQAGNDTLTGTLTFPNTGLHLLDTNASHDLIIAPGSDLTADKTLTITTGDSDRTITLSGNPTLDDWFDQSVKQAVSPTFAGLTLTAFSGYVKAAAGVLSASAIADGDLPATIKGLTLLALTTGFSIAGGTTSKTLTVNDNATVVGALAYAGLYNRNREDKWIQKGKVTAAHRYTLQSPAALGVYVAGKVYYISAQTDYDLSVEATWDSIATDYRIAATRAGKDFYIYACESASITPVIKISANASAPSGYTTANSRKIGGFHCLCVAVGTIGGHSLTGFLAGDILPDSIWDYNHRPVSTPEGMVYSSAAGIWVDIYLASGTGTTITSLYGATIKDTVDWNTFVDYGALQLKRLLFDAEFQIIAAGSNEETNITGSADPVTTGGYVDTAGRRMISSIGCEGCCGQLWQWLQDQSYQLSTLAHTHSVTVSGDPQTVATTSTDPIPVWGYYDLPGSKGSLYRQGTYGDVKLLAGGFWANGAQGGSRSRPANSSRWSTAAYYGGRLASERQ